MSPEKTSDWCMNKETHKMDAKGMIIEIPVKQRLANHHYKIPIKLNPDIPTISNTKQNV